MENGKKCFRSCSQLSTDAFKVISDYLVRIFCAVLFGVENFDVFAPQSLQFRITGYLGEEPHNKRGLWVEDNGKISNISASKSQNFNDSRIVLQLSLPSPLNTVKNDDVVGALPTGDAPTSSKWSTSLLPNNPRLILEVSL